jgi:NTE family protein
VLTSPRAEKLKGFVMPYLGQQDHALPVTPVDLVRRGTIASYPTDFNAMSQDALNKLSTRNEQLTLALLEACVPGL